jgi:hypothetical protein
MGASELAGERAAHTLRETMQKSLKRFTTILIAAGGLALLSACATPTPYMAANPATGHRLEGYTEDKIEENRYRLTFGGNSQTDRQTVENYLLYRASELTLEKGYDWFTVVSRGVKEDKRTSYDSDPAFSWRFYYGRAWSPWGLGYSTTTVSSYERYEAQAEIVMSKGTKPADNANAYSASEVKANLESKIIRPAAK